MSEDGGRSAGSSRLPSELHHVGIVTGTDEHDRLVDTLVRVVGGVREDEVEDDPLDVRATWVQISPGLRIEVVSPRSARPTPITAFLARNGGGLHHLSMATTELGMCKQLLVSAGGNVLGENDDHGGWAEFFLDPAQTGGALLHWMQAVDTQSSDRRERDEQVGSAPGGGS